MLQYTSGSTSSPGGVMLRQGNLLANLEAQVRRLALDEGDMGVSWLPLHHDLGLIGFCLLSIYAGFPLNQLPAAGFLEQPRRWLQALSKVGGTVSWAPNFAYKLCLRAVPPDERGELDLSRWRLALNAAEPVQAETVRAFAPGFRAAGLPAHAMYPAYGLAEATLLVSAPDPGSPPRFARLSKAALARDEVAPLSLGDPREANRRACRLRDGPAGLRAADCRTPTPASPCRRIGSAKSGLPAPASRTATFPARAARPREGFHGRLAGDPQPWLRTGDLGFLREGELFITGRQQGCHHPARCEHLSPGP